MLHGESKHHHLPSESVRQAVSHNPVTGHNTCRGLKNKTDRTISHTGEGHRMMNARGAGPARAALSRAAKVLLGLKHGHVCVCVRGKARGHGKRRSLSLRPNVVCERPRRLGSRGRSGIRGGGTAREAKREKGSRFRRSRASVSRRFG
jgi:hypothetical protein